LAHVVGRLNPDMPDELLVGTATGDDAAVWRLSHDRALVATADFITPVVDDARTWGRVAAANAVSDVYAMGGRPLFALNLVGWNSDELGSELLGELLAGGDDVARAGGFFVVGGHTIDDPEPKYGMSVIGEVDPSLMMTNAGLRDGQTLVLTKPLGVGVITTAIKADQAGPEMIEAVVDSMTRLNDVAARVAVEAGATGCTDVTGYGLLGHLGRMAIESNVDATIEFSKVPFLPGAVDLARADVVPGGSRRNLEWVTDRVDPGDHDAVDVLLLADAQTSGGLVFGVADDRVEGVLADLAESGHVAAAIGTLAAGSGAMTIV
jgi:selenide,water dikinase